MNWTSQDVDVAWLLGFITGMSVATILAMVI